MTPEESAAVALRMATGLQGRLAMDLLREHPDADGEEQARIVSAIFVVLLRRFLRALPVDPEPWLGEIVRSTLA